VNFAVWVSLTFFVTVINVFFVVLQLHYLLVMAVFSAADDNQQSSCFTAYVDASAVLWKSDVSVSSRLLSSDELELLVKSPRDQNKVKKVVRTCDWPVNHEVRRSLWVMLCSRIDSFTAASDGYSYRQTVQEIFGDGTELCLFYVLISGMPEMRILLKTIFTVVMHCFLYGHVR